MAIPEQARLAGERAQEAFNQVNGIVPGEPPVAPVVPAPQDEPVELVPPAAPAPVLAAPVPPAETDWEQKYRTLQGVFSAEKRVFETRLAALETQLAQRVAVPAPAPTPAATPAPASRVTAADVETYGQDLLDVVGRKAAEMADQIVAERMAALQPALDQTQAQVANVAEQFQQTAAEKFYGTIEAAVPDWETINQDQRWLAWLQETDALSGLRRQQYLDNAATNLDSTQAVALFKAFKDVAGLNPPPAAPAAPAAPAVPVLSPSPRPVGSAAAPVHRAPETGVARTAIAAHYRRGASDQAYRASAEHAAMEVRIAQALATNQVIEA